MGKMLMLLSLVLSLAATGPLQTQPETLPGKMSVTDRLIKARAAKAEKRAAKASGTYVQTAPAAGYGSASQRVSSGKLAAKPQKVTPGDDQSTVDKSQRGPHGEVIHTGARGAKYYINKNGNKTYLSSNL